MCDRSHSTFGCSGARQRCGCTAPAQLGTNVRDAREPSFASPRECTAAAAVRQPDARDAPSDASYTTAATHFCSGGARANGRRTCTCTCTRARARASCCCGEGLDDGDVANDRQNSTLLLSSSILNPACAMNHTHSHTYHTSLAFTHSSTTTLRRTRRVGITQVKRS